MRHRKLQEHIGAYADGELRAPDRARVEKHLGKCPECRRDLEFIRRIEGLPRTSPSVPQEADYWASFSGRVRSGIARRDAEVPESRSAVEMFRDSFYRPEKKTRTRAVLFPLSLAGHAAVIVLLIVMPLLRTGELPTVEVYSAFLAPPRRRLLRLPPRPNGRAR